jgi:hypothetical protein
MSDCEMEVDSEEDGDNSSNSDNHHNRNNGYQYTMRTPDPYYRSHGTADSDEMVDAADMGYEDQGDNNHARNNGEEEEDLGYEPCFPQSRRNSMTQQQERERRASIKAVMADTTLSPLTKRLSIQHLMDGRRKSMSSMAGGLTISGGAVNPRSASGENPSRQYSGRRNSLSGIYTSSNINGFSCSVGSNSTIASTAAETSTTISNYNYEANNNSITYADVDTVNYGYEDHNEQQQHQTSSLHCLPVNSHAGKTYAYSNEQTRMAERQRPYCTHYERNCSIIAACCGAAFGCRLCHDDSPSL